MYMNRFMQGRKREKIIILKANFSFFVFIFSLLFLNRSILMFMGMHICAERVSCLFCFCINQFFSLPCWSFKYLFARDLVIWAHTNVCLQENLFSFLLPSVGVRRELMQILRASSFQAVYISDFKYMVRKNLHHAMLKKGVFYRS